jgi:hypothetical protein
MTTEILKEMSKFYGESKVATVYKITLGNVMPYKVVVNNNFGTILATALFATEGEADQFAEDFVLSTSGTSQLLRE